MTQDEAAAKLAEIRKRVAARAATAVHAEAEKMMAEVKARPLPTLTDKTCGHCAAPMTRLPDGSVRCSAKCRKAGQRNVRQWQTKENRVLNIRHMEASHLHAAIAYLERNGRMAGVGYGWLCEERQRRGLEAQPHHVPYRSPLAGKRVVCGECQYGPVVYPLAGTLLCQCGETLTWRLFVGAKDMAGAEPHEVVLDDVPVALPVGGRRGIKLKGEI